jgi:hypothetical protein
MYISFTYSLCPVPRPPPFLVFAATAQMPGAPGGHGSALTAGTTAQIDSLPSAEPDGSLVSPGGPPGTADSVAGGAGPTGSTQGVGGSAGPAAGAAVTTLVYVQRVATLGNHPYPACTLSSVRVAPRVGGGGTALRFCVITFAPKNCCPVCKVVLHTAAARRGFCLQQRLSLVVAPLSTQCALVVLAGTL